MVRIHISSIMYFIILSGSMLLSTGCGIINKDDAVSREIATPEKTEEKEPVVEQQEQENALDLQFPVPEFKQRSTKKPFGIYVSKTNSPVQPERFQGYHTGIDVEFDDIESDVPVVAIASGTVAYAGFVSGYGGVVAIQHTIDTMVYVAIYGHLSPDSLVRKGTVVQKGQQIGIVGKAFSAETDGERKHVHIGIHKGTQVVFAGYVATKDELKNWQDPMTLFSLVSE